MPNLTTELVTLKASRVRLSPLLRVLSASLVSRMCSGTSADVYEAPLMELVHAGLLEQVGHKSGVNAVLKELGLDFSKLVDAVYFAVNQSHTLPTRAYADTDWHGVHNLY